MWLRTRPCFHRLWSTSALLNNPGPFGLAQTTVNQRFLSPRIRPFVTCHDPTAYHAMDYAMEPPDSHYGPSIRKALDSIAQDLLTLAESLATFESERKQLIHRRNQLRRQCEKKPAGELKSRLESDIESVEKSINTTKENSLQARRESLPTSAFIRLRRLHGRLPCVEGSPFVSSDDGTLQAQNLSALRQILALPTPSVLEDLALHLLTTSLPFSETCFHVMMERLSLLRYYSAAQSVYYHAIRAGFPGLSRRSVLSSITFNTASGNRRAFFRLRSIVDHSNLQFERSALSALAFGYLRLGLRNRAWQRVKLMLARGTWPSLPLLTRLLRDAASRRDWKRGVEVWKLIEFGR